MAMSSRERIEAALNHKQPDRTPIFEYVLHSPLADVFLGRPFAAERDNQRSIEKEKGWEASIRQIAIDSIELAERLGHDMMYVIPNPMPSGETQPPPPQDKHVSDDPVKNVDVRNQLRAASDSKPDERPLLVYSLLKEEMRARSIDLPIFAPAYAHGIWTDTDLMQTMLLAPEVAREHFRLATRDSIRTVDQYISLGIDQIGIGGDIAGNQPLISPQGYSDFILPEIQELSRHIHKHGLRALNTSDGNLWGLIQDFLIGSEVDGYMEIDMHAGMDMGRLKKEFGESITLYGNLDCGNILSFGSLDDVAQHTLECIEAGMGNGGHILTASNAITESVPLKNYLAIINAYRDRFSLPAFVL